MFNNLTSQSFNQHLWKDYSVSFDDKQVRQDSRSEEANPDTRHNRQ